METSVNNKTPPGMQEPSLPTRSALMADLLHCTIIYVSNSSYYFKEMLHCTISLAGLRH